jgi:hypothetical protein
LSAVDDAFYSTCKYIFANNRHPHLQNLYIRDEKTLMFQIFNGKVFVLDEMHPKDRLVEVCKIVGECIRWCIAQSDRPKEKKELLDLKIERSLKYNYCDADSYALKETYNDIYQLFIDNRKRIWDRVMAQMKKHGQGEQEANMLGIFND